MSPAFLFVALALLTAGAALLVRWFNRTDEEKSAEERPAEENYVDWEECQRQLSEAPPIDQADVTIMPTVDPARIEAEVEPITVEAPAIGEKRKLGFVLALLCVLTGIGAVLNAGILVRRLGDMIYALSNPTIPWSAQIVFMWIMLFAYTISLVILDASFVVLTVRRKAKARAAYLAMYLVMVVNLLLNMFILGTFKESWSDILLFSMLHVPALIYLYCSSHVRWVFAER